MEGQLERPCDTCRRNLEEAILFDEVTCFQTCKEWQKWREEQEMLGKAREAQSSRH